MYQKLYESKKTIYENLLLKMNTGLNKLKEAADSVELLRQELSIKEKEIDEANQKATLVHNFFFFKMLEYLDDCI